MFKWLKKGTEKRHTQCEGEGDMFQRFIEGRRNESPGWNERGVKAWSPHWGLGDTVLASIIVMTEGMERKYWGVKSRFLNIGSLKKCGPLEKGMANHFNILALRTPWKVMKRQKYRTLKEEIPRSVGAQYATGGQWRNNSIKNEEMEPKQKQHPVVDATGDRSKVWCYKEQYFIGTWNVRSMNQGKLEVVK